MKFLPVVLITLLTAAPALAETCTFTTECFEGEACSDANYTVTIDGAQLITDAETISVGIGGSNELSVYAGATQNAFHLLTRTKAGDARYATHIFDGPLMVNYIGRCEE
jgi:hypothetical protein